MHLWTIGPCKLVTAHATGLRQTRTPKHLRGDDQPEMLALAMQSRGLAQYDKSGHQQVVRTGDLMINDLTSPYDVNWPDDGGSSAFNVTYDLLGVPVDLARRAAPLLHTSPLYSLVQHHLGTLIRQAPVLSEDPGAPALAAATVELLRALLVSAAADDRLARPVRADTQLTRIMAYARQHLTDPGLTPARLAAVHGLSERSLYLLLRDSRHQPGAVDHHPAAGGRPPRSGRRRQTPPHHRRDRPHLGLHRPELFHPPVPARLRGAAQGLPAGSTVT